MTADAAGVSIATVLRVLSNTGHPVGEATRQRILTRADELDYRPNMAARSLRTERSSTVGIIVDDIIGPFATKIMRGIQKRLKRQDHLCVIIIAYVAWMLNSAQPNGWFGPANTDWWPRHA